MSLTLIIVWLSVMGAIGGLVNCTLSGGFRLPHLDRRTKIWRPGWMGNVLLGTVAADLMWGVYNPAAFYELSARAPAELHLTLAQLLSSLLVGISGARILQNESRKPLLEQGDKTH